MENLGDVPFLCQAALFNAIIFSHRSPILPLLIVCSSLPIFSELDCCYFVVSDVVSPVVAGTGLVRACSN